MVFPGFPLKFLDQADQGQGGADLGDCIAVGGSQFVNQFANPGQWRFADSLQAGRFGSPDRNCLESAILDIGPDHPVDFRIERGENRNPAGPPTACSAFWSATDALKTGIPSLAASKSLQAANFATPSGPASVVRQIARAAGFTSISFFRFFRQVVGYVAAAETKALHLIGHADGTEQFEFRLDNAVHRPGS